ncbi:MAG: hypothetical protein RLZ57_880 [Actinomycetota bacterium]|jgi:uncharacterized membrane protein YphA (DoxX/SURF4 family)
MLKKYSPWLGLISRLILGGVLIAAGWLKAFNTAEAENAVRAYQVLPLPVADFVGISLPWIEIGIGILLILGVATRFAALAGGVIMVIFILAIAQAGLRGLSIDCGCFGGGGAVEPGKTKYLQEIARDLFFALLALYIYRYPNSKFALSKESLNGAAEG